MDTRPTPPVTVSVSAGLEVHKQELGPITVEAFRSQRKGSPWGVAVWQGVNRLTPMTWHDDSDSPDEALAAGRAALAQLAEDCMAAMAVLESEGTSLSELDSEDDSEDDRRPVIDAADRLLDQLVFEHSTLVSRGNVRADSGGMLMHLVVHGWLDRLADAGLIARDLPERDQLTAALASVSVKAGGTRC